MPFAAPSEELVQSQNGFTAPDDDIQQPAPRFQIQNPQPRFTVRPSQADLRAQQVAARNVQPATTLGELPAALFTPSDETAARAAAQVATRTPEPVDVNGADAQFIKPTTKEDIGTLVGISPDSRAAKVISSGISAPGQLANSFTTPEGALMFASPAAGAAFVAQMATSVPQKLGAAAGAYSAGDKDAGDSNLVDGLVTAGLLTLPALHAFKKGKSLDDILGADKANDLRQQVSQPQPKLPNENQPNNIAPPENPPVVATPPTASDTTSPVAETPSPADNAGNAVPDTNAKPVLQPALRDGDKILTGGGNKHDEIILAHSNEMSPDDQVDFLTRNGDDKVERGFVDQNNNFLTKPEAEKTGVFEGKAPNSENLPDYDPNATPPPLKVSAIKAASDFDRYQELTSSLKGKTMDEVQPILKEIETIKNRNGGNPPVEYSPIENQRPWLNGWTTDEILADENKFPLATLKKEALRLGAVPNIAKSLTHRKSVVDLIGNKIKSQSSQKVSPESFSPSHLTENLAPPADLQPAEPIASLQPATSALRDSGSDVPLPEGTPTPEQPTAKGVPSTRGEDVLKAAVEKGLIEKTGDLPTHEGLNIKREASKAVDFINANPDEALKISKGEENTSGVRPEAVYTALEEKAIQGGDVATLRELANSSLPTEAGQRLKLLDSNSPFSPVKIMRDIRNSREADSERRTKTTKEKVVKEIKQSIKRNYSRLDSWEDVVRKLACN